MSRSLFWYVKSATIFTFVCGLLIVAGFFGYLFLFAQSQPTMGQGVLTGMIRDADGPIADATVRVQAAEHFVTSAEDGSFQLDNFPMDETVKVVAWADGYLLGWREVQPGQTSVDMALEPYHKSDNLEYEWEPSENCGECHTSYDEWKADAHGQSAQNPRFLSLYQGTDIHGNLSPPTYYESGFPKTPDLTKPYYGPGFKLDMPERDGNCASCHTPLASATLPLDSTCGWGGCHLQVTIERSDEIPPSVNPTGLAGVANEGISCDFCHKVGAIKLDPETGLPDHEHTGVLAMSVLRPEPEERFFIGSVDDVARNTDTFAPVHKESSFCVGCHFGVFSEVPIYNSYGEWLESSYSDEEDGQTCQDCHMPVAEPYDPILKTFSRLTSSLFPSSSAQDNMADLPPLLAAVLERANRNYFVYPDEEGVYRDPEQVHNHQMPGASDAAFLQNAVTLVADGQITDGQVQVSVEITNDKTGHHVPTGSPLRHLILVVEAKDNKGNLLALQSGPLLPDDGPLARYPYC